MTAALFKFNTSETSRTLDGLQAALTPLLGEPFRFCRLSYGDELTLHFGDLRPARSSKLKNHSYGSYILGVRGSEWLWKSSNAQTLLSSHWDAENPPSEFSQPVSTLEIEAGTLLAPGIHLLAADPFPIRGSNCFGLRLGFSDGGSLLIHPTEDDSNDNDNLPALADWELITPAGRLDAGPGLCWKFTPRGPALQD